MAGALQQLRHARTHSLLLATEPRGSLPCLPTVRRPPA